MGGLNISQDYWCASVMMKPIDLFPSEFASNFLLCVGQGKGLYYVCRGPRTIG